MLYILPQSLGLESPSAVLWELEKNVFIFLKKDLYLKNFDTLEK